MVELQKLFTMNIHVYIARPFSSESSLFIPIQNLKKRVSVWDCYQWKDMTLLSSKDFLEQHIQSEPQYFEYILSDADVLIIDRDLVEYDLTDRGLIFFNELTKHHVLRIICKQSDTPVPVNDLNNTFDRHTQLVLFLEYKNSITELEGHILTAIAQHSVHLQITKPLQT